MDNFMDKIAQKLSAQEVIRANAQADAAQLRQLQAQFEAYEECLKEMRFLNRKNTETADAAKAILDEYQAGLAGASDAALAQQQLFDELQKTVEALKESIAENAGKTEELFAQSEEFVHRENVKVYRNVQAAVAEEVKNQTEQLTALGAAYDKKISGVKPIVIITLILAAANAGMLVFQLLQAFGVF